MKLSELSEGTSGKILSFEEGQEFRRKMDSMGLRKGKVVEMISKQPLNGPFVIKVDNMKVAIGRGMAKKVILK